MSRLTWLDPCPDSVWQALPGGPVAVDDVFGEVWQYLGTVEDQRCLWHEFRHRSHPLYAGARVYAHVLDDDAGPRLSRLVANGVEVALRGDGSDELR